MPRLVKVTLPYMAKVSLVHSTISQSYMRARTMKPAEAIAKCADTTIGTISP